ncbi:hypothetical protein CHELA20_50724 [Hyphomicrobiales bacterium]|nr:hypothetical protein CHELA20_50724 [Hyphomicrobiales bacterium]CAH1676748.1 hypothetical protein CHELA41_24295 [Hyphomicrobiales bacterium]
MIHIRRLGMNSLICCYIYLIF